MEAAKHRSLRGIAEGALRLLLIAVLALGAGKAAAGQHEAHGGAGIGGPVPAEILKRPVPLRQGIGKIHEAVSTTSAEAQAFYDQGLAYVHSFVWIEAARSFNQALRADPKLAMAELGLSDAYIGLQDFTGAAEAFAKAQALSANTSAKEQARLEIRGRQLAYLTDSGNLQKYFAYRQSITDALARDPQDPWLWILRGFADEGTPLAHGQGGGVDTIAFYQTALVHSPGNFAAHHYLAHTLENHGPPLLALQESAEYVRLAPAIPHAHHMHGHNLRRTGQTEAAIQEFLKAEELEDQYYKSENIPAKYDWHHAHNLQLLAMSYEALGQMKLAEAAFREAFAQPAYTDFAEFNRRAWPEFLLSRGRADEALAAAQEIEKSQWAMGRFAGHAMAGRAMLAMDRMADARNELTQAEQEMVQMPAAVIKNLEDSVMLRGEILLKEKEWNRANALMNQVIEQVLSVPGPDAWSEALFELEAIAKVARDSGDWELAAAAGKKMVEHDPSYGGGYLAVGLVAEHNGDAKGAEQAFNEAKRLWSRADPGVAEAVTKGK